MFITTPIYFGPEDEAGAAVEAAPADVPAIEPEGEVQPEGEAAPVEEPAPVDWAARVDEWGGETSIAEALAIREALSTREGVTELFRQASVLLGVEAAKELLGIESAPAEPAGEAEPTIDELLADPERVLTAGELQRILAHERQQAQTQTQAQRQAQAVISSIESTFEDLKIEAEDDRIAILTLADSLVPADRQSDPAAVAQGIRTAHAKYQDKVKAAAEAIVAQRAAAHDALPTPLPAGGSGGGEPVVGEPQTLAEAKERARKQMGLS